MNCPGCHAHINEKDLICPSCKKVLKLQCPSCKAVTKNTVCEKCGSVILNKCYKCGKLNSTALEKCPKCGLNVNASIGLKESVIEEFAVLTIEITNFEDIKALLNSDKLTAQFKKNLYTMIKKTAAQKRLRVQFIEDTFIIRFCKDYSFVESCISAVDFSIYIAQSVTEINKKLFDTKGITLKTQMAIQKRDVYSKPSEYKSGINISVVYSSSGKSHLFNNIEVVADSYVYQAAKTKYPFQSLSAVYIKNQMVMFFELILHKIITLNKEQKTDINKVKLPENADFVPEEEPEDKNLINFSSLNCTFMRAKGENLLTKLEDIKNKNPQNPIISIKTDTRNNYLPLISTQELEAVFNEHKIIRFACPEKTDYSAYGLLKQIILSYKEVPEIEVLLDPLLVEAVSQDSNIQNLLRMKTITNAHPEDLKFGYYESFTNFITSIPFKTIFVIDDFHNTDESSIEVLKYLVENKELGNIGFIVSNEKDYSLHRKIYKLMTSDNYFEIEMKPSANKTILAQNLTPLQDVQKSFFLEKVLENTKGSHFYFNQALNYLLDNKILGMKDNKYFVQKDKMIVIPKDLDELIQKRILHLCKTKDAFEFFGSILLVSQKMSVKTAHSLGFENDVNIIKYLETEKFIKIIDDKEIEINNYNLFRKNFVKICEKEELQKICSNLLEKIYLNTEIPNNIKAEILEYAKLKKEAFAQWHSLAMISSQIGDFCTYLNCTNKFLSLVDNVIDEETDKTVEQVKMEVYTELASMLYKYYPDKIINFLEMLLANLEEQNDDKKIKEISNKLVQSCLISGNYNNALEYIGKIISRTPRSSFNPASSDFNLNYFLINLVTLEIYFNLGRLNECIELGEELFRYIDFSTINEKILPEGFSKKQFEDALLDAQFFINASRVIQLKPDTKEKLAILNESMPQKYTCFMLLSLVTDFFEGKDIIAPMSEIAKSGLNDKYSYIIFAVLQALISMRYQDWGNLGNYIYNAKIKAMNLHLHQINSFCDLMIGYAYQNLNNLKKAKQIYYNILDISSEKGLKNISYLSWFLIAKAEYQDNAADMAMDILNNSIIKMENDTNISEFFIIMFKTFSAQIMLSKNPQQYLEHALFCAEQSFYGALKNKLYIYIPQIADTLMFIYSSIAASEQKPEVIESYTQKINNLKQTMSELFQSAQ